jgi:hypothetical protein
MQAYKDPDGMIHLGVDYSTAHLPFDQRVNAGHVVLAPFKNEPDKQHTRIRDAREVGASVRLKAIDNFPATGLWLGAPTRLIDTPVGAPEESVVLAFVGRSFAALVRDHRSVPERCIDHQTFWIGPKGTTVTETTFVVRLVENGQMLLECEYLLKLQPMFPVVYLLTDSE